MSVKSIFVTAALPAALSLSAQCDRWQQRIRCSMDVELDVRTHRFSGEQELRYTNNSPDTLRELYFHLYFNAFRPGSEMDVRSRTIADPDERIGGRIAELKPEEQGELQVTRLTGQGREQTLEHLGTVLRVRLEKPILPGRTSTFELEFEGQVPVQIRRSGRDNADGIAYSMTQWYPKVAAYDDRGWHADPYVAREFYGEWGDYDVRITLDSSFTVAATGVLQNAVTIGRGYDTGGKALKKQSGERWTWHFLAKDVHDFAWAADPDYVHTTAQVPDGPLLHFFHQPDGATDEAWAQLPAYMVRSFQYMSAHFGRYPWPQFSFVQGGDGGMEYPMLTLITGGRRLGSLVGVSVHESVHSWYYGVLASNEGQYPWMDEGMTEYASSKVMQQLFPREGDPHAGAFRSYEALARSDRHEPMSLHADHFSTNFAYGVTAYSKGELMVHQLAPVIGERTVMDGLRRYWNACAFEHPRPVDLERSMEKASGLELDWYYDEWMNTVRELDYGIAAVMGREGATRIVLRREGEMLMPVDLAVELRSGEVQRWHVPLSLTLGAKAPGSEEFDFTVLPAWQWTDPEYAIQLPVALGDIVRVEVDPDARTADLDRSNNAVVLDGASGFARP